MKFFCLFLYFCIYCGFFVYTSWPYLDRDMIKSRVTRSWLTRDIRVILLKINITIMSREFHERVTVTTFKRRNHSMWQFFLKCSTVGHLSLVRSTIIVTVTSKKSNRKNWWPDRPDQWHIYKYIYFSTHHYNHDDLSFRMVLKK